MFFKRTGFPKDFICNGGSLLKFGAGHYHSTRILCQGQARTQLALLAAYRSATCSMVLLPELGLELASWEIIEMMLVVVAGSAKHKNNRPLLFSLE